MQNAGNEDTAKRCQRAEKIACKKATQALEDPEVQSPEEMRTLHELQVYQIELEMQNEELRRVQAALEAAQTRYFDLYDLAPVGYCTLNEEGLILEANLTAVKHSDGASVCRIVMNDVTERKRAVAQGLRQLE